MKRKLLFLLLIITIAATTFTSINVLAETEGIYTYTVSEGKAEITQCSDSASGSIVVPETLGGCPVTGIGDSAFYGCKGLTTLSIPDSVETIGEHAFRECSGLTGITLPKGIESISGSMFGYCINLTEITIPDSVTSIGDSAFSGCEKLTDIIIPDKVTSIGSSAFYGCSALNGITLPDSLTHIGDSAFYSTAFYNNSENRENGILYIGKYLIDAESTVSGQINIKNGTLTIATSAFMWCKGMTGVTIPESVKNIGYASFRDCSNLTNIDFPDSLLSIGDFAFDGCSALTEIVISLGVTSIGDCAFRGCTNLDSIDVDKNNKSFSSLDGNLYNKNKTVLIQYATGKGDRQFVIPAGVTEIADSAFCGSENLGSITFSDTLTCIGNYAFEGCAGLINIDLPDSVNYIGNSAFEGCAGLIGIILPDRITYIGSSAFKGCSSLTNVIIPRGVTRINNYAFERCNSLECITLPDSVTEIGVLAIGDCTALKTVFYNGNQSMWDKINVERWNWSLEDANKVFFCYVTLIDKDGYEINRIVNTGSTVDLSLINTPENHLAVLYCDKEMTQLYDNSIPVSNNITLYVDFIKIEGTEGVGTVTTVSADGKRFTVLLVNAEEGGMVILALYDGKKFVEIKKAKSTGTVMIFNTTETYTYAKVMVWSGIVGIAPVCYAETVR